MTEQNDRSKKIALKTALRFRQFLSNTLKYTKDNHSYAIYTYAQQKSSFLKKKANTVLIIKPEEEKVNNIDINQYHFQY